MYWQKYKIMMVDCVGMLQEVRHSVSRPLDRHQAPARSHDDQAKGDLKSQTTEDATPPNLLTV